MRRATMITILFIALGLIALTTNARAEEVIYEFDFKTSVASSEMTWGGILTVRFDMSGVDRLFLHNIDYLEEEWQENVNGEWTPVEYNELYWTREAVPMPFEAERMDFYLQYRMDHLAKKYRVRFTVGEKGWFRGRSNWTEFSIIPDPYMSIINLPLLSR